MDDNNYVELWLSHRCYVCRVYVPNGTMEDHKNSQLHKSARTVLAEALRRFRNHINPVTKKSTEKSAENDPEAETTTDDEKVTFCGHCTLLIPIVDLEAHNKTECHIYAEQYELVFEERVREYIDGDLLSIFDKTVPIWGIMEKRLAVKTYECHLCNLELPEIFKEEHEKTTRHLGSVALATEATNRASLEFSTSSRNDESFNFDSLEMRGRKMTDLQVAYYGIKYYGRHRFYYPPSTKTG